MEKKTGIWIDTKEAVIITINGNEPDVLVIDSDIDNRKRISGEGKWFTRFGNQFADFGRRKKNRRQQEIKHYLNGVAEAVKDSAAIVIFGPAGMKNELSKWITEKMANPVLIKGVETTDSMTRNQMVAWVKNYFS